jgi:hypothetical protein
MNVYLGIDPGKRGAIAITDSDTWRVTCHDMPPTTQELHDLIAGLPTVKLCTLEKLHAGPVMGRTTIATMFMNYGILKGALMWRDIPFKEVRPSKWKPGMGLSKDKNASRELAMQRFPDDAEQFKRVNDDGRAEAALLAIYGAGAA